MTDMDDFVKAIKFGGKNYFFLFSEIAVKKGKKFFVTTGKDGNNVYFEAVCDEFGTWKLIGQPPEWIREIEVNIIDELKKELGE